MASDVQVTLGRPTPNIFQVFPRSWLVRTAFATATLMVEGVVFVSKTMAKHGISGIFANGTALSVPLMSFQGAAALSRRKTCWVRVFALWPTVPT